MECQRFSREEILCENLSDKFKLKTRDFSRQYAHVYAVRLNKLKPILAKRVEYKWGMYTVLVFYVII